MGRPSGRLVRKFRKLLCVNAKGVPELENVGNPMLAADPQSSPRKYLAIPGSWHSRQFPVSRELQNYNKSLYFMIKYYIYRISLFLYIYIVACIILKFSRILKLGGESRITRYFREPDQP